MFFLFLFSGAQNLIFWPQIGVRFLATFLEKNNLSRLGWYPFEASFPLFLFFFFKFFQFLMFSVFLEKCVFLFFLNICSF